MFQYIEHSILRYDFVYDIIMYLFQVLPLLHWISEFSKDRDYNVFRPSIILWPHTLGGICYQPKWHFSSECQHVICWHTKGHLWIEGCLNTIDGHEMRCIHYPTNLPFYLYICWLPYATISTTTRVHTRLSPQHPAYCTWVSSLQPPYRSVCGFPL